MKKRTLALLLTAVMLFVLTCGMLTACDNSGESSGAGESSQPETSESTPPEPQPEVSESAPPEEPVESVSKPFVVERRDDFYAWYYDKKAVLADMTSQEACDYLVSFFLSGGTDFTDPNTLPPEMLLMLLCYKNSHSWELQPGYFESDGVRMTYDEVIEELQHYLDIDPDKVKLRERVKSTYMASCYDKETDTFLFNPSLGGVCANIPLEDRWEGDRRIITIGPDPAYQEPPKDPKYSTVFTLEQNGEYVRYVSYEIIPIK